MPPLPRPQNPPRIQKVRNTHESCKMCLCSMHALQRAARGALPCDWERAPWLGSRRAAVTKVYIYKL